MHLSGKAATSSSAGLRSVLWSEQQLGSHLKPLPADQLVAQMDSPQIQLPK
ncbi:MAG: hypothetical protein V4640_01685 [Verrucomicrobiota bacterium]